MFNHCSYAILGLCRALAKKQSSWYRTTTDLSVVFFLAHPNMAFLFCIFSKVFFWRAPFVKVFIEFVTTLLLFYAFGWGAWLAKRHVKSLFPTRAQTCSPCIGRWSLNHWTAREVPCFAYLYSNCGPQWLSDIYARIAILPNRHFCLFHFFVSHQHFDSLKSLFSPS